MKFRNKKTGEEYEAISHEPIDIYFYDPAGRDGLTKRSYYSLAELNDEWEDYEPKELKEPLIKDEKMRQCVKLWAEINEFKGKLMYSKFDDCCSFYEADSQEELLFLNRECPNLKHAVKYTIAELCGDSEEEE